MNCANPPAPPACGNPPPPPACVAMKGFPTADTGGAELCAPNGLPPGIHIISLFQHMEQQVGIPIYVYYLYVYWCKTKIAANKVIKEISLLYT